MTNPQNGNDPTPLQLPQHPPRNTDWNRVLSRTLEQQIIVDFFSTFEATHGNPRADALRRIIQTAFSIWQFSRIEVICNAILCVQIRILLEDRQVDIPDYVYRKNLARIGAIWNEEEFHPELAQVWTRYEAFRNGDLVSEGSMLTPRQAQTPGANRDQQYPNNPVRRLNFDHSQNQSQASNFAKINACYKYQNSKYGGTNDENLQLALTQYDHAYRIHEISQQQKVRFVHTMLKGDALQFYYQQLEHLHEWTAIANCLKDRYQSDSRIHSIEDELDNIRITDFETNSTHEGQALQSLARRIETLVPQCPQGRNDDTYKRKYLYKAVRMKAWSDGPISSMSQNTTYNAFLDSLTTADQNKRIREQLQNPTMRKIFDYRRTVHTNPKPTGSNDAVQWFQGQARYGRDPRAPSRKELKPQRGNQACFNCGTNGHTERQCRQPRDEHRIMKARIKHLLKNQTKGDVIRIIKKLLSEQSAHINFLSDTFVRRTISP